MASSGRLGLVAHSWPRAHPSSPKISTNQKARSSRIAGVAAWPGEMLMQDSPEWTALDSESSWSRLCVCVWRCGGVEVSLYMDTPLLCVLEVTVILIHIVQQHHEKDALSPSQGGRGRWDGGGIWR